MAYKIQIRQGDLLDEPSADFIVNPSNTTLTLGSGVSGAFARACGAQLQQLMTEKRKATGRLAKGDVVETPPGSCSRFHRILHACVMDYNRDASDTMPTLNDIGMILNNMEKHLSRFCQKSGHPAKLVIPLMGTGVGGLEKKAVISLYRQFFARPVTFECDVVLYGHSASDTELIRRGFT